jgi:hypothetical protein
VGGSIAFLDDNQLLLRALLLGLIGVYRRCFAGRGPLRNVRCTFGRIESCSVFGERMARDAPTTWAAVSCIFRRLRRCRDLSLFRLPNNALGWGKGFDTLVRAPSRRDAVGNLDDVLARTGENADVRAAVREAAFWVLTHSGAAWRGGVQHSGLLVRDALAVRRAHTRRFYSRGAMAIVFAGLAMAAAVAGGGQLLIASLAAAGLLMATSAWTSRRLIARVGRLEILAAIEGPLTQQKLTIETTIAAP